MILNEKSQRVRLGDFASFKTGKLDSNAAVENGKYPFFTCSRETFRTNTYSFDDEVVLLAGNNAAGVYPLKYFKGKFDVYQRTYVIRPIDQKRLDTRFLYYSLFPQLEHLRDISTGAATKFLTMGLLNNLELALPDLPTQRKIAGILSAYDDLIENNLRRIRILEEMAQSLYREWFVHFRFPGHESVPIVDSPLGPIPEGWEVKAASDLASITIGKTPPRKESHWFASGADGVPWVSIKDMNAGRFLFATDEALTPEAVKKFNIRTVPEGTVLLSFKLTVGRVSISVGEVTTNEAIAHFPLTGAEAITPEFLFCYLSDFQFETLGSTSSIGRAINSKIVKAMPVLVPPSSLIERFSGLAVPVFKQLKSLSEKNQTLRQTRDLLLPKLLSPSIS